MDIEPLIERDVTILCPMCGVQFHPKLTNIC